MAQTTVNLIDEIGGKELKALVATNDGAGNNIASQFSVKIDGEASANYSAPQKITVVSAMPSAANIEATTIYLIPLPNS